jgi:hypothetical protein
MEQIGWIMSRVDELPHTMWAQEEEKERNELERKRFFAKELVNPAQVLLRLSL